MGLANTVAPKTNQQNFDDYITGPKTVTVTNTKEVGGEQPYEVHLAEFPGKPYKPNKSMRRVLLKAWGDDDGTPTLFAGRRITLYGDPDVTNMGEKVGGLRISHLSHIAGELVFQITEKRGVRKPFIVRPLSMPNPTQFIAAINAAPDLDTLRGIYTEAQSVGILNHPDVAAAMETKKKELGA